MQRTLIVHALAACLIAAASAAAKDVKAGPRDTVTIERTHQAAARYAALAIGPADLAAADSDPNRACTVHRAGPRDSVRIPRGC